MNKLVLWSCAVMLSALLYSCEKIRGEGPVVTEERTVGLFSKISSGIGAKINFTPGPSVRLELQAQQNILNVIETPLVGDELVIKFRSGTNVRRHEQIVLNITAPSLEGINISGSDEFTCNGTMSAGEVSLNISGSGSIRLKEALLDNRLKATVSGSGNITVLGGDVKEQSLTVSGSGSINTTGMAGEKARADISGSGNISLNVSGQLDAFISGSGSVYYKSNPVISTHISGSGTVRPL